MAKKNLFFLRKRLKWEEERELKADVRVIYLFRLLVEWKNDDEEEEEENEEKWTSARLTNHKQTHTHSSPIIDRLFYDLPLSLSPSLARWVFTQSKAFYLHMTARKRSRNLKK